jgi:hypothetical protein
MSQNTFDRLECQLSEHGVDAVFDELAAELKSAGRFHELFDVLLMRTRHRLGLSVILTTSLDDLPEPLRSQVEEAYLAACREVGMLLLGKRQLREAWMYLRPVGERAAVAAALADIEPSEENLQDLIEIALHEGVAPELGYGLLLKNYGTCNAISAFEASLANRSPSDQQAAAGLLLGHLHRELVANVRADIARREGREPSGQSLAELVAERDWLFADNNYHVDTTHLAATIRFARLLVNREHLALALDLTDYGRQLGPQFQFTGDEPFVDVYPSHGLFFAAQLGRDVERAVDHFRDRARQVSVDEQGTGPGEVLIALLARLGRYEEAIEATIEHVPRGARTSGFAPTLFELARLAGNYEPLLAACRQREDLVGYTAGLVAKQAAGAPEPSSGLSR